MENNHCRYLQLLHYFKKFQIQILEKPKICCRNAPPAEEEVESVLSKTFCSISNSKSTRVNDLNPQVKVKAVICFFFFYSFVSELLAEA